MSWTLSYPIGDSPTLSITFKNAEFDDADERIRRQAVGETDGGLTFIEDLGEQDDFFIGNFEFLDVAAKSDMTNFFGPSAVNFRQKPFRITITSNIKTLALNTGMIIDGVPLNTGQGYNTGDLVAPDTAILPVVFLDQNTLSFQQQRNKWFRTSLRFRLFKGPLPDIS